MRHLPLILAAALMGATAAQAAVYRVGLLEVSQPWSRPAAAGTNGAGYFTVTNRGKAADALVSAATPAAARVEIHASTMTGGMMKMQKLARLDIPAGKTVTFGPGAYHLMLIGLKTPLKAGDKVPATLVFASGAKISVSFEVRIGAPGAAGEMDRRHH